MRRRTVAPAARRRRTRRRGTVGVRSVARHRSRRAYSRRSRSRSQHPERWRYIPEGRIKPGNIFERFLVSSFIAPFFFRDTDVGFGGGLASPTSISASSAGASSLGVFLSHTTEGQQAYTAPLAPLAPPHRRRARRHPAGGAEPRARRGQLQPHAHPPLLRLRRRHRRGRRDELHRRVRLRRASASTWRCPTPATTSSSAPAYAASGTTWRAATSTTPAQTQRRLPGRLR